MNMIIDTETSIQELELEKLQLERLIFEEGNSSFCRRHAEIDTIIWKLKYEALSELEKVELDEIRKQFVKKFI